MEVQARVQNTVRRVAGATITPGVQIGRVCRILEQFHCDLTGIRIAQLEPVRWIGRRLMLVGTFSLVAWIVVPPFARSIVAARRESKWTEAARADALRRAAVWHEPPVPIERADLSRGRDSLPDDLSCRFEVDEPSGTSPKFDCVLENGEHVEDQVTEAPSRTVKWRRPRCCAPWGSAPITCNSSSASAVMGARGFLSPR